MVKALCRGLGTPLTSEKHTPAPNAAPMLRHEMGGMVRSGNNKGCAGSGGSSNSSMVQVWRWRRHSRAPHIFLATPGLLNRERQAGIDASKDTQVACLPPGTALLQRLQLR